MVPRILSKMTTNPSCNPRPTVFTESLPHPSAHHILDALSQRTIRILKHHSASNSLSNVSSVHSLALKTAALSHISARTSLLTAYARAGDPSSSLALFQEADSPDVISWNAVITAFLLNSRYQASIALFQQMLLGFREFDSTTLLIALSALSRTSSCLNSGCSLHALITKKGFHADTYLCNALIDMYANSGVLSSSESLFRGMEVRDSASWNSMITGYLHNGFPRESVYQFREMSRSGVQPDEVSISCVISACSCLEQLYGLGQSVHGLAIKLGYEGVQTSISNSLISFYSCCGHVHAAEHVFRGLAYKNAVSWNSMFGGLVENGRFDEALDLFQVMQSTASTEPDAVTVVTLAQVCGYIKLPRQGKSVHGFSTRREMERLDSTVSNVLLDMYLKCDAQTSADVLFRTMPNKDLISWNTMIHGYSCNSSLKEETRSLFGELLQTGLQCSLSTLLAILPSCTSAEDLWFGRALHGWKLKYGFNEVLAVNALMLMYINCGDLATSTLLLKSILKLSDVSSWNTVIVSCVQNGYYRDALKTFNFMQYSTHLHPDPITLVSTLSACGNLGLLCDGMFVHGFALKTATGSDIRVSNALLTMYFRCADTESAETLFQTVGDRNLCSWNCMISGFVQNKAGQKAFEYFHHIEGFHPNEFSLVGVICACTQLGDLIHGKEINGYIFRFKLHGNVYISSALVDMYSKCGRLDIAVQVFENLANKSIASWNSMISAYGLHGHGRKAIKLFSKMVESGTKATKSTFVALLSACGHSGLVDEGWNYYNCMLQEFGVEPSVEHHVCIMDMLGRAGRLSEAYEFVKEVLDKPEPGVWGSLLSACNDHGNLELGKSIAEHLFNIDPENTGYYVTVSNLYAHSGKWSHAEKVRGILHDRGLVKPQGYSFIDVLNR